jgi:centrosomal protein CEP104
VLVPFLDPVVQTLVDKLADGNHRFRDAARKGINFIADAEAVGPNVVIQHVLKPLGDKLRSKNAWRPVVSRLALLKDMVASYGFGGGLGFSPESIMGFMRAHACFSHSHAEVRDAARDLTVAVQALVGSAVIDAYLQQLRPRQVEEYQEAFAKAAAAARTHSTMHREWSDHHDLSPRSRRRKQEQQKKVNTAASRAEAKMSSHASMGESEDEGGAADFTKCMFCGAGAPHWNEDALDLHYWKDCPVLAPCPACAQVVEVAGLPEHLLRECEYRDAFVHCKTTGLAIRKSEWAAWEVGPNCLAAPSDSFYCPLCLELVLDSDPAWRKHLVFGCRGNARGSFSPSKGTGVGARGGEGRGLASPPKENPHWYAMS